MRCCVGVGVGVGVVGGGVLEWVECSETHTHSLTHARTTNEWPFARLKHPLSVFVTSRFVCSFVRLLRCCCSLQCMVALNRGSPSQMMTRLFLCVLFCCC